MELKVTPLKIHFPHQIIRPVTYSDKYPKFSAINFKPCGKCEGCKNATEGTFNCERSIDAFNRQMTTKAKHWEYESEWRVLSSNDNSKLNEYQNDKGFKKPLEELGLTISAIITGTQISCDKKNELEESFGAITPIRNARLSKNDYRIVGCFANTPYSADPQ